MTLISGLGGRSKVEEHALSCAKLITAMNPEYASFLTLRLYEGTPMYADVVEGRFQRITPDEIVDEMEIFLKKCGFSGHCIPDEPCVELRDSGGNLKRGYPGHA